MENKFLTNTFSFFLTNQLGKYLRAMDKVYTTDVKNADQHNELKEQALNARFECGMYLQSMQDIYPDFAPDCMENSPFEKAVEFFTGSGEPPVRASSSKAKELAETHGIDMETAAALALQSAVSATEYAQQKRGHKRQVAQNWLDKIEPQEPDSVVMKATEDLLIKAYRDAGQFMARAEGLDIEAIARENGIKLPEWRDVLPKTDHLAERVSRLKEKYAARVAAEQEAFSEALKEIGDF